MRLRLRPANDGDAERMFAWVNSVDSLASKRFTSAAIPWETHVSWLAGMLRNPAARLWIVEQEGHPVGQLRLAPDGDGRRLVDIYIVPEARQSGLAAAAVRLALAQAARLWPCEPVLAEVLTQNQPSHRLFRSLGFREAGKDETYVIYAITP